MYKLTLLTRSLSALAIPGVSFVFVLLMGCAVQNVVPAAEREVLTGTESLYFMPSEEALHEGTWLQWPHDYGWDRRHVERYESAWVEMTRALHTDERVHIIAYNQNEKTRITARLQAEGIDLNQIDFFLWETDDVWIRDNGPVFVRDTNSQLVVTNWEFNGWGNKADWQKDNLIPGKVATSLGLPEVKVSMVNEGGSVELDGQGTLMAKKSSILNTNRNPGWTQADAEAYFRTYLGATHFIWLEGKKGGDLTDDHIDGTARFVQGNTLVTYLPEDSDPEEYARLSGATNAAGQPYELVHLPMTERNVPGLGERGIYLNFYVGNGVVLVPNYDDPQDQVAIQIMAELFPGRRIVGIPAAELAADGGMVHCVTQQQPAN